MTANEKEVLYRCCLFNGISDEGKKSLLSCLGAKETAFQKNEILWRMGDDVPACAVVLSGQVRAETVDAAGQRTVTAIHGPGHIVGDVLMATPGGRSPVYVVASRPARALLLPYRAIMGSCGKCCPHHARLRENLIAEIAHKYWLQRRRIRYLTTPNLRQRICLYLMDMADGRESFCLGTSREDMADYLGVNRSAMSRELSRMRSEGLLHFHRDQFTIIEREKLERLVK